MPPRWPRQPSRQDPEFRKLDDRYTYAAHIAIYLTAASGLTFFNMFYQASWPWLLPVLGCWGLGLGLHTLWIFFCGLLPSVPSP
ncbi:MAG: Pr2TM family membrane protein [Synechococcaceae cyanobacterium SM2_3_1]|nr:Pr2TM family membrane protein [Synechococcaceae cyanobacterium SM2_3_1]